jgi:hypothetical protein
MSRLTLSIDDRVIERAKKYAARHGTSVSQLVEEYLDRLSRPPTYNPEEITPLLTQLRAGLKGVSLNVRSYKRYLTRKYRRGRVLRGS